MPASKTIIGVDLDPIKPIPNVITFVNDITTQSCRMEIKKQIKNAKAEVVLHDGAPNVGTAWTHDAFMQAELTLSACRLATEFLAPNGTFVTKVFRSAEYTKLLWVFHQLFTRVTATKPQASRNVSAEIFVVCEGYLAPKKIDPKLLDPKHVLTSVDQKAYAYSVFAKKESRHRTGYDEGVGAILHKKRTVRDFVTSDDPVAVLSSCNTLHFEDEDCKKYLTHAALTEELKICFSDLKVLGKRDFKALLKWRATMRAEEAAAAAAEESEEEEEEKLTPEQEDAKLLKEMDDHMRDAAKKAKKKAKKVKELQDKNRRRMALTLEMDVDEGGQAMFDLKRMNKQIATDVSPDFVAPRDGDHSDGLDTDDSDASDETDEDDLSDDERERRYQAHIEGHMDALYTKYLLQTRRNKKRALHSLQREGMEDEELDGEGGVLELPSEEEVEMDAASRLIVKDADVSSAKANLWFEEPMFKDITENTNDETAEMQRRLQALLEEKKEKLRLKRLEEEDEDADDESMDEEEGEEESDFEIMPSAANADDSDLEAPAAKRRATDKNAKKAPQEANGKVHIVDVKKMNAERDAEIAKSREAKQKKSQQQKQKDGKDKNGGVKKVVAKDRAAMDKKKASMDIDSEGSSEDSVDSDFEDVENNAVLKANETDTDYDTDEKAEIMAMAKKLSDPTQRAELTTQAFSKRSFTDAAELPRWFKDDEKANNRPLVPVTREEFQQYRDQLKAIDSRATHRVAEAQARKKKRMARAMEKAKAKAGKIIEADDIPDAAKKKELERIFAKAKSKFKPTKTYVVGGNKIEHNKSKSKGQLSFTRHVDKRLKTDKRAARAQAIRSKKRKRS